jgi:CspA family cold shock protein
MWSVRRPPVPARCAHLDLAVVQRELTKNHANVSATAKVLGVPVTDLRRMTWSIPPLIDVALEAGEVLCDEAEARLPKRCIRTIRCGVIAQRGSFCCITKRRDVAAGVRPKGYGFLKPDDGGVDVLVSICALERAGMASLDQGQRLSFEVVRDERIGRSCAENLSASELQARH